MKTEVDDLRGQIDHLTKAKVCNNRILILLQINRVNQVVQRPPATLAPVGELIYDYCSSLKGTTKCTTSSHNKLIV